VIVALPLDVSADASTGATIATLMTTQKIVSVPLNEVDASKVKVGQKATLAFDAIDGLSLTGEVVLVNPIGTVSQGVVNYAVHVAFDSTDDRIKSGMSASVSIITQVRADVLTVPNSAIKTQGETSYVEEFSAKDLSSVTSTNQLFASTAIPQRVQVETGVSNDELTEIVSGLTEGQKIISQTVKATTARTTTTSAASSAIRIPGVGGGGR
jgi:multidrug resistance efflux pump